MPNQNAYVGVTISEFSGYQPSTLIKALRMIGVEFFELNRSIFPDIKNVVNSIDNQVTAFHLPLMFEDNWDLSCLDHKAEIDETINTINAHRRALNLQHVVCHPPEPGEAKTELRTSLDFLFENLKRIELPVFLENVMSIPEEQYESIYSAAQNVLGDQLRGMCFDAPHFFIRGQDPIKQYKKYSDRAGVVHLSDCFRDRDVHIPFNAGGQLPVEDFLQTLRDDRFQGFLTLEIQPTSMRELDPYVNSYVTSLKYLHPKKYRSTVWWTRLLSPILRRVKTGERLAAFLH